MTIDTATEARIIELFRGGSTVRSIRRILRAEGTELDSINDLDIIKSYISSRRSSENNEIVSSNGR